MKRCLALKLIWLSALLACVLSPEAHATAIINGGFEAGFAGWTRSNQVGSEGAFALQTGISSPVNGTAVPAPPGGSIAAMTDAAGPGSHVLSQTFTVDALVSLATLSFDLFIGNRAGAFFAPNTLDFSTAPLNQQARVDIIASGADPFSLAPGDVLLNLFKTNPGDALVSGYTHLSIDVTSLFNSHVNVPLTLRFAETDNVLNFQMGVDNVAIQASPAQVISAPSSWILTLAGLFAIFWVRRRDQRPRRA
jgi:MYXO-CTERM domain-containing protein